MHESGFVLPIIGVLELLVLASLSAVAFRHVQFPYTIGLVIVGIMLAVAQDRLPFLEPIRLIRLTPDVVLYLVLPTLIFPAAVRLDLELLKQNLPAILLLAFPGLILSTVIVGGIVGALTALPWSRAMLFGALISATDPIAVVALFKDLKVSDRLSVLVDGESLFNDATAIVLFTVLLSAIGSEAGGPRMVLEGAASFVLVSVGGFGVGALLAVLYAALVRLAEDDPLIEIALSMVLAYTAFLVAHHSLNVSGIMAVVGAGLVGRRLRRTHLESATETRAYLQHYWSYAEFVANSFVFLLLGIGGNAFLNRLYARPSHVRDIAWAVLAVVVARLVVVYGLIGLLNKCSNVEPIGWREQTILFWGGGMRGALPLALALSLSATFEQRQLLFELTAGVVLFTLLIPGTTVGRLIRSLGAPVSGAQVRAGTPP